MLTPKTLRNDAKGTGKKCGNSYIPANAKCNAGTGAANTYTPTQGLEKGNKKQLLAHKNQVVADLRTKFAKSKEGKASDGSVDAFVKWAKQQPEVAELKAVSTAINKKNRRNVAVGVAGAAGLAALTAGAIKKFGKRNDRMFGNGRQQCGPNSKPCGDACIPRNHKCRANWNKPAKAVAATAAVAGAGVIATAFFHPRQSMRSAAGKVAEPVTQIGFGIGNIARGNPAGATVNFTKAAISSANLGNNLNTLRKGYGQDLRNIKQSATTKFQNFNFNRKTPRRDSVWATGFNIGD